MFQGITMHKIQIGLFLGLLSLITGCVSTPVTANEGAAGPAKSPLVSPSESFSKMSAMMADQLSLNQNVQKRMQGGRIAIASFVNIDDLGQASQLGIQLAENLMHEMHVRGFSVVDYKTRDALKVSGKGDFVFSRDLADLKRAQNINYFLAGTISLNADGAVINARLIETETNLVSSTGQGFLAKKDLHRLLNGERSSVVAAPQPVYITLK